MQPQLGLAGFLDRANLRPQVIGAQKIVADPQQARVVAF
jgi:hypothetical protein